MSSKPELKGELLFKNSPEVLTVDEVTKLLSIEKSTVYGWSYKRKTTKGMPEDLFIGKGKLLRIKTSSLRTWLELRSA